MKIQLYKYRWNRKANMDIEENKPDVFYSFDYPRRVKYSGFLKIELLAIDRPLEIQVNHAPVSIFQHEVGINP